MGTKRKKRGLNSCPDESAEEKEDINLNTQKRSGAAREGEAHASPKRKKEGKRATNRPVLCQKKKKEVPPPPISGQIVEEKREIAMDVRYRWGGKARISSTPQRRKETAAFSCPMTRRIPIVSVFGVRGGERVIIIWGGEWSPEFFALIKKPAPAPRVKKKKGVGESPQPPLRGHAFVCLR